MPKNNVGTKQIKVNCQQCDRETNHAVLQFAEFSGHQEDYDIYWWSTYQIIQCNGCDTVSFRKEQWDSETEETIERLYPERRIENRANRDYENVPHSIIELYRETLMCYNNGILVLCAAGIRALIEAICTEQRITGGQVAAVDQDGNITESKQRNNLEGKINALHEKGILTKNYTETLHEHRFLGNDALHKMLVPREQELDIAIDIIEHVMETVYEIPYKGKELVQARKKRQAKTGK